MSAALAIGKSFIRDGDTVAMIGDSITADARWWLPLREQWLARNPGAVADFRNCGIPGGNAAGALSRYEWDIAAIRPTVAFVMFGMNDVWREGYAEPPTPSTLAGRAAALQKFLASMDALVGRLAQDGVRTVLLTPSPYDQYTPHGSEPNRRGVDDALAVCAGMVRGIAVARGLPVIDLHTPLQRRCAALEPLIAEDRVHPAEAGHRAMAEIVLREVLPGAMVGVPPSWREVSRELHDAEFRLRLIAMFRSHAQAAEGSIDDDAVVRYCRRACESEPHPWLREQMLLCPGWMERRSELEAAVEALRRRFSGGLG